MMLATTPVAVSQDMLAETVNKVFRRHLIFSIFFQENGSLNYYALVTMCILSQKKVLIIMMMIHIYTRYIISIHKK